ncbi:hypothetical protein BCV70DRAFT_43605 [Testicularia cyperi]|uniref:Uncharacterized protein n=1 Tax=Testicularia cyperi TaxID=1882483 RepID=A0A317XI77_9BASI|nr:hypothetical protein BCV70DRAFT_43605 [Testicularia cyperi]
MPACASQCRDATRTHALEQGHHTYRCCAPHEHLPLSPHPSSWGEPMQRPRLLHPHALSTRLTRVGECTHSVSFDCETVLQACDLSQDLTVSLEDAVECGSGQTRSCSARQSLYTDEAARCRAVACLLVFLIQLRRCQPSGGRRS